MKLRYLVLIYIYLSPLFGATNVENGNRKEKKSENIVDEIFESAAFKRIKSDPNRYRIPNKLRKKIAPLSEEEKEKELLNWFTTKEIKAIRRLIFFKILWRIVVFLMITAIIVAVCAYIGKTVLTAFWHDLEYCIPKVGKYIRKKFGRYLPEKEKARDNWIQKSITMLEETFVSNDQSNNQLNVENNKKSIMSKVIEFLKVFAPMLTYANKVLLFSQTVTVLYSIRYFIIPIHFLWKLLKNVVNLFRLYYNPLHEDPMRKAEHMYIKSIYLYFHKPFIMRFLEEQLFNTRSGDISKVNEMYELLKAYRAIPFGVKPVVYDQRLIDELFETYSPEMREVAEWIIAEIVMYSQAMKVDRPDLLAKIALKNVLLYGPPGTGKSHFFKLICKALGINYIPLFILNAVDVRGKPGDKIGHGQISAYGKALMNSADETGRNYLNAMLIIEEIDKIPHEGQAFMHVFLDPKVKAIEDRYLHTEIPKILFIFATTNFKEKLIPAIIDRFTLIEVKPISNEYKKKIVKEYHIPAWIDFLSNPALQEKYGHDLDPQKLEKYLTGKMVEFIDNNETGPGMRTIEEELEKEIMKLMANIFREKNKSETGEEDTLDNNEDEVMEDWNNWEWEQNQAEAV